MTMMGTTETSDVVAKEATYGLALEAIEATGRSLNVVLGDRLCDAAVAKLKGPTAWRTMTTKELLKLLRDNCADQDGYLSAQQPVLETVFRMLLVAPEGKLTLGEIHSRIADLWMTSPWPRHITIDALQRVLDNGVSYGIVRVDGE